MSCQTPCKRENVGSPGRSVTFKFDVNVNTRKILQQVFYERGIVQPERYGMYGVRNKIPLKRKIPEKLTNHAVILRL